MATSEYLRHAKICPYNPYDHRHTDADHCKEARTIQSVIVMFDDVNDKLSYWMTLFLSVFDRHAPLMKVRMKKKSQDDDWIDSELWSLMRSRNYYRKKHRKTHAQ